MAAKAPDCIDTQEIQFKLHDKLKVLQTNHRHLISYVNLLTVASTKGLLFAANHDTREFRVFKLRELVDCKDVSPNHDVGVRVVAINGNPYVLSCSSDGTMLAVNYIFNNAGYLEIYSVDSFLTQNVITLYNIQISPQMNVFALQILWNPVIVNSFSLVLTSGWASVYILTANGQHSQVTLSAENRVKCGCWSPKGKQIVYGLGGGKLQQFKPTLAPARNIPFPPDIQEGVFDVIAVQWLSTYQFAAALLTRGEDKCPTIYIVNAPKNGNATFINYYDVCYSSFGPRSQQINFYHIQPWNLLCISSANGVEVAVLGTKDSGEYPVWCQYALLDDARIELPLTEDKEESYPMGLALNTSCGCKLIIGDVQMPEMPLIHILSSDGNLISYIALNVTANAVSLCSPIPPLVENSGQFKWLKQDLHTENNSNVNVGKENITIENSNCTNTVEVSAVDSTFTINTNTMTSTPAIKEKSSPVFNVTNNTQASHGMNRLVNATTTVSSTSGFSTNLPSTVPAFSENLSKCDDMKLAAVSELKNKSSAEFKAPLYTVSPKFAPPPPSVQQTASLEDNAESKLITTNTDTNNGEMNDIIKEMIALKIDSMDCELKQLRYQTQTILNKLGSTDEIKLYTKQLHELHEIVDQANDPDFEQDVQSLRHSMNDAYAMLTECRIKLDTYSNPDLIRMMVKSSTNPANRRQLVKLRSYVDRNGKQLEQLEQLVELQWSEYQDIIRRNSKHRLHIPCLDGVYQKMSKLKDMLSKQRIQINYIKSKLKQKGLNYKPFNDLESVSLAVGSSISDNLVVESLTDSILSLSLSETVAKTQAKLSTDKLNAIRSFTKHQQTVNVIQPKRPDRIGLKSEVILETKLHTDRLRQKQKTAAQDAATKPPAEMQALQNISAKPSTSSDTKLNAGLAHNSNSPASNAKSPINQIFANFKPPATTTNSWNFDTSKTFSFSLSDKLKAHNTTTSLPTALSTPNTYGASSIFSSNNSAKASISKPSNSEFNFGDLLSNSNVNPIANLPKSTTVSIKFANDLTTTQNKPTNEITLVPVTNATSTGQSSMTTSTVNVSKPTQSTTGGFSFSNFSLNNAVSFPNKSAMPATSEPTLIKMTETLLKDSKDKISTATADTTASATVKTIPSTQQGGLASAGFTEALSASLNICKLSSKAEVETSKAPGIFSSKTITTTVPLTFSFNSESGSSGGVKSFFANSANSLSKATNASPFGQTSSTVTTTSSTFSFGSASAALTSPILSLNKSASDTTSSPSANLFSTNTSPLFASSAPKSIAGSTIFSTTPASTTSTAGGSSVFSSTTKTDQSIFNNAPVTTTSPSVFATVKPTATDGSINLFSSVTKADHPTSAAVTTAGGEFFTTPVSSTTASIFNNASTNVFNSTSSPTSIFANAASIFSSAASTEPGGPLFTANKPAEASGNLFAAAVAKSTAAEVTPTNIFASATKPAENTGNIFGGNFFASAKPVENSGSSIFGSSTEQNVSSTGGSIFGKSTFAQTTEQAAANPFAGLSNQANKTNIFNTSGNSIFGGTASNNASSSGNSLFSAANTAAFGSPTNNTASGGAAFGPFSQPSNAPAFGSPTTGTFGQSPSFNLQQTSTTPFTPPSFGSPPPAFGAQPTFGGAPMFAGAKSFGSFANSSTTFGSSAAAKGNIFETLGSSNTGLSFGNLAESNQQQAVQPKPAFGGSSFMNYRS